MIAAKRKAWVVSTLPEVADFFSVAVSTVRGDWRPSGMPGEPGAWDLSEIMRWRDKRRTRNGVATADDGDLAGRKRLAETLLVEEQHRKVLLGNEELTGELLPRRAVELSAAEMVLRIKGRLEFLPDEFEMTFPSETRHQNRADLSHKVTLLLRELAATKLVGGTSAESMILKAAATIAAERAKQADEVTS